MQESGRDPLQNGKCRFGSPGAIDVEDFILVDTAVTLRSGRVYQEDGGRG